jgi:hypothetical protein
MLSPRLTNCIECTTITFLLSEIDCKIAELAKNEYNNVVFALNYPLPGTVLDDLLNYKRILRYRYCSEDYAPPFTINEIASRVKVLIHK